MALPLHPSGEAHPLFQYIGKIFTAPLVISMTQEMHGNRTQEGDISMASSQVSNSIVNGRSDEVALSHGDNDAQEKKALPQDPNYHFMAILHGSEVTSKTAIAVLCMAEHSRLPLLMTSLLYQRWTWRIDEPLFGIGFSPYDTVVKLYVAWLDDDLLPNCVLVSYSHDIMHTISDGRK